MDTPDAGAIRRFFDGFMIAFNGKDLDALRSCYTDDALVMPPGQAPIRGPDAIIDQLWRPTFDAFNVDSELPVDEVQVGGDWGFVSGTYDMRLEPIGGGDRVLASGSYVDVVRKDTDGAWKIARAIWNVTEA